jgi:bifunctional enzyme CysN/CysC/sulfate adenylyltransferase subunit 1
VLEDDIDVSRGSMLVGLEDRPGFGTELRANVCWMHARPLQPGRKYLLKHTSHTVQAVVTEVNSRLDMGTLEALPSPAQLAVNDIGEIRLRTARPLFHDAYGVNRLTGSFILIEPGTNATVAAGMLQASSETVRPEGAEYEI